MTPAAEKITVIGGGLAGSLVAIFLARRGYSVEVYERRPDLRKVEIPAGRSINLALAERGIEPLKLAGVFDQVKKLLTPMRGRLLHAIDGILSFQPYGQREGEVIHSVSRGGLNALLMNVAELEHGIRYHFGQRCLSADFSSDELSFRDETAGRQYSVPLSPAVAADGAYSAIRVSMQALPTVESNEVILPHSYKELNLPPGPGGKHQMETHALHIWPRGGFMLIALPNLDGSFTVTLFLATDGDPGFSNLGTGDQLQRFFEEMFPDALSLIPELRRNFFTNPTGSLVTVRCLPWHVGGQVVLLGDAAHAVVPFHGQGMNCAFEDCAELGRCIDESGPDWDSVFSRYQTRRKPNAEAIADMALENYVEMRDQVRDSRFVLRKEIAWELERRYPDRFIPRYSMVMFHHEIPYAEAKRRGEIQSGILDELIADAGSPDTVNYEKATSLITTRLEPLDQAR